MLSIITNLSVAQVATIINAAVTFLQITISLSLVILLVQFMPKTTSALSWSSISRMLHSSLWPAILRTDSDSSMSSTWIVATVAYLSTVTTVLVAIAGVALPLGLRPGPLISNESYQPTNAQYVRDTSDLGSFTAPNRGDFQYQRTRCGQPEGVGGLEVCPSNISSPIQEIFNSTPHGPFSMQYRFGYSLDMESVVHRVGSAQYLFPRNDLFLVEGLVVDMSSDHPGIGFRNHTIPISDYGATWSEDILWLEPQTSCVDTNFTLDLDSQLIIYHGDTSTLANQPSLDDWPLDGQNVDVDRMAYTTAIVKNHYIWRQLDTQLYSTHTYRFNEDSDILDIILKKTYPMLAPIFPLPFGSDLYPCEWDIGDGSNLESNSSRIGHSCKIFATLQNIEDVSAVAITESYAYTLTACSSVTRASLQNVTFSANTSHPDLQKIHLTRNPVNYSVLWGKEINIDPSISGIDPLWGRVADEYEHDSFLWTIRSSAFYVPHEDSAGGIEPGLPSGNPSLSASSAWKFVYNQEGTAGEYFVGGHWKLDDKIQNLIKAEPLTGQAKVFNLIWTDIIANNLVGTQKSDVLLASKFQPSLQYDLRFAIPGFILIAIWAPSFLISIALLISRTLTFKHIRNVLNHASIGRVITGSSALRVIQPEAKSGSDEEEQEDVNADSSNVRVPLIFSDTVTASTIELPLEKNCKWAEGRGQIQASLDLLPPNLKAQNPKSESSTSSHEPC